MRILLLLLLLLLSLHFTQVSHLKLQLCKAAITRSSQVVLMLSACSVQAAQDHTLARADSCALPFAPQICDNQAQAAQPFKLSGPAAYAILCQWPRLSLDDRETRQCLVAARSLMATHPRHGLLMLVPNTTEVEPSYSSLLLSWGVKIHTFQPMFTPPEAAAAHKLSGRNNFMPSYQKLVAWSLIFYQRIVVIDADIVVVENLDFLFALPTSAIGADCTPHGGQDHGPHPHWVRTAVPAHMSLLICLYKPD